MWILSSFAFNNVGLKLEFSCGKIWYFRNGFFKLEKLNYFINSKNLKKKKNQISFKFTLSNRIISIFQSYQIKTQFLGLLRVFDYLRGAFHLVSQDPSLYCGLSSQGNFCCSLHGKLHYRLVKKPEHPEVYKSCWRSFTEEWNDNNSNNVASPEALWQISKESIKREKI